eukprot:scaffold7341_cov229-Pinguiococcus_pyrenoidosus.AAC.8
MRHFRTLAGTMRPDFLSSASSKAATIDDHPQVHFVAGFHPLFHPERREEGLVRQAAPISAELAHQRARFFTRDPHLQGLQALLQLADVNVARLVLVKTVEDRSRRANAALLRTFDDLFQVLKKLPNLVLHFILTRLAFFFVIDVNDARPSGLRKSTVAKKVVSAFRRTAYERQNSTNAHSTVFVGAEARHHPVDLLRREGDPEVREDLVEAALGHEGTPGVLLVFQHLADLLWRHVRPVQIPAQALRHVAVVGIPDKHHEVGIRDKVVAVQIQSPEEQVLLLGAQFAHPLEQSKPLGELRLVELALLVDVEVVEGLAQPVGDPVVEALSDEEAEVLLDAPVVADPDASRVPRTEGLRRYGVQQLQIGHAISVVAEALDQLVLLAVREVAVQRVQGAAELGHAQEARQLVVVMLERKAVVDAFANRRLQHVRKAFHATGWVSRQHRASLGALAAQLVGVVERVRCGGGAHEA